MNPEFRSRLQEILARAGQEGVSPALLDRFGTKAVFVGEVSEREAAQPEFTLPIRRYIERVVSVQRIAEGRDATGRMAAVFDHIEGRFGVDRAVLAAIWGIESAYGTRLGGFSVPDALATLAGTSGRGEFFEDELVAALRIVDSGAISLEGMIGSWAGAMGHTQFMPSSYLAHAVSFRGSGHPDIWGKDPSDALASTANYLAIRGWREEVPWGFRVELTDGFDHMLSGLDESRPVEDWAGHGVRLPDERDRSGNPSFSILLPAGHMGPAFLVSENFGVLRQYNRSIQYALSAGLLADRISGSPEPDLLWPADTLHLSRAEILAMQRLLVRLGHDTGGTDGIVGPATVAAVRDFQRSAGLVPDGHPDRTFLRHVEAAAGGADPGGG